MPDRFKYSEVRQKIINALRTDLMGPQSENEILDENPKSSYIIGMLASQTEEKEASTAGEQEVDSDIAYGDSEDYTAGEDDDNEPIMTTSFKLPTSIGISFYIASSTKTINIDVKWGDYVRSVEKRVGKDVVLVYKCRQKKLNSLYYKKKEQRRCSTWRKIKNRILRNSSSRSSISTMPEVPHILNWNMNMA